jgi:probable phosphomutase (TIGR03848 family)
MTRFLLIRHATTASVGKRLSGRIAGVHLNEQGQQQAQQLANRLAHLPIHAIYCSPLERATETAAPLAQALQLPTIISEDFLEINFGDWTNLTFEEVKQQRQFNYFNSFRSNTRIPGGESMLEAQARIIAGLQKLALQHPNQTVAVVSHADLIKSAISYYAGTHLDLLLRFEISPASVSIVELYEETARLMVINDTGGIQF